MVLIRIITLQSLLCNSRVFAEHVRTEDNSIADAISRLQVSKFHCLCDEQGKIMDERATPLPECLVPEMQNWIDELGCDHCETG